jgi:hypothetical protein
MTTAYWSRPGANLAAVAGDADACYRGAIGDEDAPSALAVPGRPAVNLLPRSEPPPRLWSRSPGQAGLEHFDEQARYAQCMRARGWIPVGSAPIRK